MSVYKGWRIKFEDGAYWIRREHDRYGVWEGPYDTPREARMVIVDIERTPADLKRMSEAYAPSHKAKREDV